MAGRRPGRFSARPLARALAAGRTAGALASGGRPGRKTPRPTALRFPCGTTARQQRNGSPLFSHPCSLLYPLKKISNYKRKNQKVRCTSNEKKFEKRKIVSVGFSNIKCKRYRSYDRSHLYFFAGRISVRKQVNILVWRCVLSVVMILDGVCCEHNSKQRNKPEGLIYIFYFCSLLL